MARESTLDEFGRDGDADDGPGEEADGPADDGPATPPADDGTASPDPDPNTDPPPDPDAPADRASAPITCEWTPDGAACEACGATVERRWLDGAARVCADCKEW